MGEFVLRIDNGKPWVIPNLAHDEGIEKLLACLFPPHNAVPTLKMRVCGYTTQAPWDRPNAGGSTLFESTTWGNLDADASNKEGSQVVKHRTLMGLDEDDETVTFTVTEQSGGVVIASNVVQFTNALSWTPTPDSWYTGKDPPLNPPKPWNKQNFEPLRKYPWHVPTIDSAHQLRTVETTPEPVADAIGSNMHRGASYPISSVFIADNTGTDLYFSAHTVGFELGLKLRPVQSLYVQWRARIQPRK